MDLTPQLFRDVQFTERRGAYDREEVDAFLARVGTAVGQLQERVREAQRRFEAAEDRVATLEAKRRESEDANETMQRMIETAARFADEAMKEAKDDAEQIVAGARKKADDMIAQAEEAIRRDVGATRDRLEAEIRQLERHRDELTKRISDIDAHLTRERTRLRGQLEELIAVVDDPDRLAMASAPGSDPEPVIVLTESRPEPVDPAATAAHRVLDEDDDLSDLPPPPEDWEAAAGATDGDVDDIAPPHSDLADDGDRDLDLDRDLDAGRDVEPALESDVDDAPKLFDQRDDREDEGGPPTEAHPIVSPGSAFGGTHLDELRRAVSDEATDPEADAAMAAFFDQDTDDDRSRRFGRRR